MKVVRITRHPATPEQLNELRRIFGEVEIVEVSETLPNDPRTAVQRFDEIAKDADLVEVVLPLNLLDAILRHSRFQGRIIRAVMNRTVVEGESMFSFSHYEEILKVEIVTQRL